MYTVNITHKDYQFTKGVLDAQSQTFPGPITCCLGKKFRGVLATNRVLFRPNLIYKELVTLMSLW